MIDNIDADLARIAAARAVIEKAARETFAARDATMVLFLSAKDDAEKVKGTPFWRTRLPFFSIAQGTLLLPVARPLALAVLEKSVANGELIDDVIRRALERYVHEEGK